jgi:hypothetical protein
MEQKRTKPRGNEKRTGTLNNILNKAAYGTSGEARKAFQTLLDARVDRDWVEWQISMLYRLALNPHSRRAHKLPKGLRRERLESMPGELHALAARWRLIMEDQDAALWPEEIPVREWDKMLEEFASFIESLIKSRLSRSLPTWEQVYWREFVQGVRRYTGRSYFEECATLITECHHAAGDIAFQLYPDNLRHLTGK